MVALLTNMAWYWWFASDDWLVNERFDFLTGQRFGNIGPLKTSSSEYFRS